MTSFKCFAFLPLSALISLSSTASELGAHCWQQQPDNHTLCFTVNKVSDKYYSLIGENTAPDGTSYPLYGLALFDEVNLAFRVAFTQNTGESLVFENTAHLRQETLSGTWRDDQGNSGDFLYLGVKPANPENSDKPFNLGILHINDHHSHLKPDTAASLTFNGQSTTVEMGGFPRIVTKIKERAATYQNVLKLHAGDAITGDLYYTLFKGGADATLMNQVCFDAFSPGSHEFDYGDTGLKEFLDYLNASDAGSDACRTATLAANVAPAAGVSPLAPHTSNDYLKPYLIKQFGGVKVGIIGIVNANLTKNSSSPDPTTQFYDEATTAQRYIDELHGQGINKIILMSSYGYQNDLKIVKNLSGVDVIIGGGSHTLLGDNLAQFGLNPQGSYPTLVTDKEGNPVCIAHAWQYALAVGELNVSFTADGRVESCTGTPHLLLGDNFKRNGVQLEGAALEEVLNLIAAAPALSIVTPDPMAAVWVNYAATFVDMLKQSVIGKTGDNLCLDRVPGQGLSKICAASATRAHGSDIANIVALAFKNQSKRSDLSIQNAGGVRIDIPAGDISIASAYALLPFANTLVNLEVTGAELVAVLEEALDYAIAPNGANGAYPYASGLRWTVNLSKPKGQRFSDVQVKLKTDSDWKAIDLARTYVVVTSNYLASGKDGYQTFAAIFANPAKVENTSLEYAQAFVDYVKSVGTVAKLPVSEYSTQSFYDASGKLQSLE